MEKTFQPTKSVNNQPVNNTTETVQLPNGEQAAFLVANLNKDQKLAVVDESVLAFLIGLLPSADLYKIISRFRDKLSNLSSRRYSDNPATMEEYLTMLRDELRFHENVNVVKTYFTPEEIKTESPVVVAH